MSQSQRERALTQRLIAARRTARGKSQQDIGKRLHALIEQVRAQARLLKAEQQRLLRLARTPGFRYLAPPEEARAAWEMRLALARHPLRPPRPPRPRKGGPAPHKETRPLYYVDWKIAQTLPEMETAKCADQHWDALAEQALAQLKEGQSPQLDLADVDQRVRAALADGLDTAGGRSAPQRLLRQRQQLTNLLYELRGLRDIARELSRPSPGLPGPASPQLGRILEQVILTEKIYHPVRIVECLMEQLKLKDRAELLDAFILAAEVTKEEMIATGCQLWFWRLGQDWGCARQQLLEEVLLELLRGDDEPGAVEPRAGAREGVVPSQMLDSPEGDDAGFDSEGLMGAEAIPEIAEEEFYEEEVTGYEPDPAEAGRIYAALEAWRQERQNGSGPATAEGLGTGGEELGTGGEELGTGSERFDKANISAPAETGREEASQLPELLDAAASGGALAGSLLANAETAPPIVPARLEGATPQELGRQLPPVGQIKTVAARGATQKATPGGVTTVPAAAMKNPVQVPPGGQTGNFKFRPDAGVRQNVAAKKAAVPVKVTDSIRLAVIKARAEAEPGTTVNRQPSVPAIKPAGPAAPGDLKSPPPVTTPPATPEEAFREKMREIIGKRYPEASAAEVERRLRELENPGGQKPDQFRVSGGGTVKETVFKGPLSR